MAEPQPPVNGGGVVRSSSENLVPCLASKRQRRPSVRLGDIGGQRPTLSSESFARRSKQLNDSLKYRHNPSQKDTSTSAKSSKTRPLTNLSNGGDTHETLETNDKNPSWDGKFDSLAFWNQRLKDLKVKKGVATKKLRSSNWVSKVDEGTEGAEKFSCEQGRDEGYRDFDPEGSASPLKEHNSPIHSPDNPNVKLRQNSYRANGNEREEAFQGQNRPVRVRVSSSRDVDAVELDGPSDIDARDWKCRTSADGNGVIHKGGCQILEDGVLMWLNGLGLGQYVPVFEVHEVDENVLPLLTLDDLKDMGIKAVGARRKIYCAIQKLRNGSS